MEAIHAKEAGEVGHQAVVPLRLLHRLLSGVLRLHGRSSGGRRFKHGPRVQGGDAADASPPAQPSPPVRRQLFYVGPLGRRPDARRHLSLRNDARDTARVPKDSRCCSAAAG